MLDDFNPAESITTAEAAERGDHRRGQCIIQLYAFRFITLWNQAQTRVQESEW
jgi:hypothetical protein